MFIVEAELATREWLIILKEKDDNQEVKYLLENLLENFISFNSRQKFESLLKVLESKFCDNYNYCKTNNKVTVFYAF